MDKEWLKSCKMLVNKIRWKYKNRVEFEQNSRVYSSCSFEGYNRICRDSYISNSDFGYGTYVGRGSTIISTHIGRFTSIGPNVRVTSGNHPTEKIVSMHPAFYSLRKQAGFTFVRLQKYDEGLDKTRSTKIGSDVWIGDSALILEGVSIGDGAVVAAGAIVTKDVPPYAIVVGTPAKVLKYRFSEIQRAYLLEIKWWEKDILWIKKNAEHFSDVEIFISLYKEGEL